MPKPIPSYAQVRQRQLAWALYVLEGAAANLAHALAVNTTECSRFDLQPLRNAQTACEHQAALVRHRLQVEASEALIASIPAGLDVPPRARARVTPSSNR